jgi:hypothetical protein
MGLFAFEQARRKINAERLAAARAETASPIVEPTLSELTVVQLREKAEALKIKIPRNMKRADIVALIERGEKK